MKLAVVTILSSICLIVFARADLTMVQKIDGGSQPGEVTVKIKGEKLRIESTPRLTTIVDTKTGALTNLMPEQKAALNISADQMRSAMETMRKMRVANNAEGSAKLTPTGKKEKINGYDTEQYTLEAPNFKTTYWIAPKYPNGGAILKQLQALGSEAWNSRLFGMPDYKDLPGLPIRTTMELNGTDITATLVSVKQDPLSDDEFAAPKDFKEVQGLHGPPPRKEGEATPPEQESETTPAEQESETTPAPSASPEP